MSLFHIDLQVSFGDCDPAGIVYYPNFCRWTDRAFHALLHERLGGHAALCRSLGARGFGLMDVRMRFRSPAEEGDHLRIAIAGIDWKRRSFDIAYEARCGERLVFTAAETRGVFVMREGRMRAGEVAGLKARLEEA